MHNKVCKKCTHPIYGRRGTLKQTKYCVSCARVVQRKQSEESRPAKDRLRREYMRKYMAEYRKRNPRYNNRYVQRHRARKNAKKRKDNS